jgi:DNA-binding MarR family transcriptional regulator
MMSAEPLKPCPYRETKLGHLVCNLIEQKDLGTKHTNLTLHKTCCECRIPEIEESVNCLNLNFGKKHEAFFMMNEVGRNILRKIYANWDLNCSAIGFSDREEYEDKCSKSCSAYRATHHSLVDEKTILLDGFSAIQATDRDLRQAILAILYKYHARHPERFDCFDITPEFIGQCLGIDVSDVVRVIAPMEEEGEVTTKRYAHDIHFRYVAIRSKGIRMIDDEPLFERLNTAQVRTEMNFHGPTYGPAGNVQGNQSILEKD